MINRSLIRLKVVQLLYSYLLTQSEFNIESPVENPSRDKKYGYELYIDLLLLMLELSGYDTSSGRRDMLLKGVPADKHIDHNQLAKALNSIDSIRQTIALRRGNPEQFAPVVAEIYSNIPNLPAYKSYVKIKKPSMKDDVTLWLSIIHNLFARNKAFEAEARKNPAFTLNGFNRAIESLKNTLSEYGDNRDMYLSARNELDYALTRAYDLYNGLLLLAVELTSAQAQTLELNKEKYQPTDEDLHPNMRFVENKFIKALSGNSDFEAFIEEGRLSWETDLHLQRSLLELITNSSEYAEYMALPGETTLEQDADIWRVLFKQVILPSDVLAEALEQKSIYWNDDLHVMSTFVLKTIRRFGQSKDNGADISLLPKFKDREDERFGPDLFMSAVSHYDDYKELIEKFVNTKKWETDRLAFMDIVIMVTAIAEIIDYPAIPLAVSLNEYIEIANFYSTPRSGSFINGILYSVIQHLKEEGKILKN